VEKIVTDEVTETPAAAPAAPAAPGTEAPAAAPAASVVKSSEASLLDGVKPGEAPAGETPKWFLSEGVGGQGDAPDWFKADKYKTVDEQARAYQELEKRFGAFEGAPKDGVYKVNPPEGIQVEFDTENQLFQGLNKWAKESNLSQKGYDEVIGMLAQYEMSLQPDMGEIKKQVGENADARLSSASQWAKSNLSTDEYAAFSKALTQSNAAEVFKVFETVIAKTRQVHMPKPDTDVTAATDTGLKAIIADQNKRNDKGDRLYDIDPEYRMNIEKRLMQHTAAMKAA
jgi:hypothetical protein